MIQNSCVPIASNMKKSSLDPQALESIPGIGKSLAKDLRSLGIKRTSDLKGKDPEKLYRALGRKTGSHQDSCVLYTFRCAIYFASHARHDPEKLKWWNWKEV